MPEESALVIIDISYYQLWINGVVDSLHEANKYFKEKIIDNKYFTEYVSVWDGTKKICSYTYNEDTSNLEKKSLNV